MEKVIRNGIVAVLISPHYGAGWSTWCSEPNAEVVIFDPDMVAWVENGKVGDPPNMEEKYGFEYFYDGGADALEIVWVPEGARFRIKEHDGYESLVLESDQKWITA
jgi:hypothetical protein